MAFWATIAFLVPVPPAPFITQKAVVDTEDGHVPFSFHHVLFVLWDVTSLPRSSIFLSFYLQYISYQYPTVGPAFSNPFQQPLL